MGSGTNSGKQTLSASRHTVLDINDPENGAVSQELVNFRKMSDAQQAKVIQDAMKEEIPSFLPDNPLQRLAYYLGGDSKPEVVTDSQLDAISGVDIYRQVAGVHLNKFGVNYSSADIVSEIIYGEHTQYSNSGGSAFGRSLYFGSDYGEIQRGYGTYATNRQGGRDSTLIRAKVDPKAKGMTNSALNSAVTREINSGSALGKALSAVKRKDPASTAAVYALAKGIDYSYDMVGSRRDYHMVYNRGCLKVSNRTKHNANDSSW